MRFVVLGERRTISPSALKRSRRVMLFCFQFIKPSNLRLVRERTTLIGWMSDFGKAHKNVDGHYNKSALIAQEMFLINLMARLKNVCHWSTSSALESERRRKEGYDYYRMEKELDTNTLVK